MAENLAPHVARNLSQSKGAVRWSWRYLKKCLALLELLLPAYTLYLKLAPQTRQAFEKAIEYLKRNEKQLHPVLDVHMAARVMDRRVREIEPIQRSGRTTKRATG